MGKLDGNVAVVTGGARGQGRAHALSLATAGADIVLCDIGASIASVPYPLGSRADLAETAELVGETGRRCVTITADVRDQQQMNTVAERAIAELGHIDILLANAGIASNALIAEMPEQTWRDMIDVNLTGVYHSFRAVVPHMLERGRGRIVATSSIVARMGARKAGHYAAAKWGVIGLVKSLAEEVGGQGITVNAVLPSGVQTDMIMNPATYRELMPDVENPTREAAMAMFEAGGGLIQPAEVSELILLLVSDAGGRYNGEAITISNGLSTHTI
ncbi:mycofactocin-coupled SDR family oxidoreductase [Nocardia jinanensis]|uniref:3-oxoacyl-[acyl-carrier-protein] reductase MabA n=1 Tax=Nocardia jinanensis TaxID=382504 RepID=A0A917RW55_9NOCA|nr:mycofactocin-coupled SDR family oxidoreductase [Nocardia jinanensis]GGL35249.1 putative short-chain dehydrogenase/reductase [Nocardia jinanensis]